MSYGFEVGKTYNRVADIHAQFGGSPRGGIITTNGPGRSKGPIFIVTGETGLQHGYADRWRADGAFEYFGEGQVGDMQMIKGNRAIATSTETSRSILLFGKEKSGALRFRGELVYEAHHIERAPDRAGNQRDAIVFELRALDAVVETVDAVQQTPDAPLHELQQRALKAAGVIPPSQTTTPRTVYQRSRDVKIYVLARAGGYCEGCRHPAPFTRADGTPYLEPHHIRRVSDGGPDHPGFVIALCPNCHRRVHAGGDGPAYNSILLVMMHRIEPAVTF